MAGMSCLVPGEGDGRAQGCCGLPAVAEREVEGVVFPLCEEHTRELDAERGPVQPGSRVKKRDADVAPVRAGGARPLGVTWIRRAEIINTEERHAQYPEFRINSRRERESLRPGDFAKLVWEGLNVDGLIGGERMWVEVTKATKGRNGCAYEGTLRNTPVSMKVPKKVRFGPEHIASIQAAELQRNCLAPRSDDLSGRGEDQ